MNDEATPYWFCSYCQKRFVKNPKKVETFAIKTITSGLECLECHDNFTPKRNTQNFCSKACRFNHNAKKYYLKVRHTKSYKKQHILNVRNWEKNNREKYLAQKRIRHARYRQQAKEKNDKPSQEK